ncbi:hypothetical protein GCM10007923_12300 [Shinella yambaruensis]|uniref:Uncharacterized protein n=1 Tax=Shinella yambaruensis TaxID=415996 RepID=A0ABQ5ZDD4_9HYPH|nr:hypothetical protein GCM10007923_12300 [Shinella yambaruensis]
MAGGAETSNIAAPPAIARHRSAKNTVRSRNEERARRYHSGCHGWLTVSGKFAIVENALPAPSWDYVN